ncbi:MAG: hypothetical protein WCF90_01545 [Methanomicrobiales archaeon]
MSEDTKALPIRYNANNIVPASLDNVKTKNYRVSRDLYVITDGPPSGLSGDFIKYIISADGQRIVANEGYVTPN